MFLLSFSHFRYLSYHSYPLPTEKSTYQNPVKIFLESLFFIVREFDPWFNWSSGVFSADQRSQPTAKLGHLTFIDLCKNTTTLFAGNSTQKTMHKWHRFQYSYSKFAIITLISFSKSLRIASIQLGDGWLFIFLVVVHSSLFRANLSLNQKLTIHKRGPRRTECTKIFFHPGGIFRKKSKSRSIRSKSGSHTISLG